jgi:hypothetical protein
MAEIIPFDPNHKCRKVNRKASSDLSLFERIANWYKKRQHKNCAKSSNIYKSI